eukprot:scaffold36116_cov58-Phaeocystis_antarctica.AAC.7
MRTRVRKLQEDPFAWWARDVGLKMRVRGAHREGGEGPHEGWRGGRGKLRGSCIRGARRTIDPNPNPNPDLDPTVILTLTLTLAQPLALALSLPPALILTVTPPLTLTRAKGRRPHLPGLAFWRPRHLSPWTTRRCLEDTCFQRDDAKNNAAKVRRDSPTPSRSTPSWCVVERKLHDRPPFSASWRVIVFELLAPCVERVASEGGVVLEVVRDQPLDMVLRPGVRL